jgi:hypothetical protein
MKKITVLFFLFAVLFTGNISAQYPLIPHGEGDFTINIPAGWQLQNYGLKYNIIFGPADGGFSPNINFVEEAFTGTASEYIDAALQLLANFYNNFRLLSRGSFTTNSGLQGEHIVYQAELNNVNVWMKQYAIRSRSGTTIMIISGGAAPALGSKYESLYDDCIKTFNWSR